MSSGCRKLGTPPRSLLAARPRVRSMPMVERKHNGEVGNLWNARQWGALRSC